MTKILAVFLLAIGVVGCIVVGLIVVLIFNINLRTFSKIQPNPEEQPEENKIPSAEDRRPDGGFFISQ